MHSSSTSTCTFASRTPATYWETRRLAIADRAVYEAADHLQRLEDLPQLCKDRRMEEREEMTRKQVKKNNRPRRGRGGSKIEGMQLASTSSAPLALTSTIHSLAPLPAPSHSTHTLTQALATPLIPTSTSTTNNSMDLDGNPGSVQEICNDINNLLGS
jgi:hypothetical protein